MGLPYYLLHYSRHMESQFGFNVFSLRIKSRMTAYTYMIDEFLAFLERVQDQRLGDLIPGSERSPGDGHGNPL